MVFELKVDNYVVEEMEDAQLVQLSQSGNREAFGELVRRHRAKVYGYAQSITQERYMAEDIVQDALVRAFLHLGKLVEPSRFLPWLHRIVRNQAYTKLKSRVQTSERVFSSLRVAEEDSEEGRFQDLDYILHRLTRTMSADSAGNLPEERIVRQEILETIINMLNCLSERERRIFESHFFDHLSPQEIAKLFQLSSANVYQILSRSRKKVMQEKVRIVVDHYMKNRRDLNLMSKLTLTTHEHTTRTWTTAASAIHHVLKYTDKQYSLPMVMGLTGFAFQNIIFGEDVNIAGPTLFHFDSVIKRGLRNLGYEAVSVEGMKAEVGPNANLIAPSLMTSEAAEKRPMHDLLPNALDLIHRSINRGYPVVAWDVFIPEFGVIYGYDDEQQTLYAADVSKEGTLSYNHLGRSLTSDLFVVAIDSERAIDPAASLRSALDMILEHYAGKDTLCVPNSAHGIAAYDLWISAFRNGQIEPNGNSYCLAVVHDARLYATAFLQELSTTWKGDSPEADQIRTLCADAAAVYKQIAEELDKLVTRFPFPVGGEPNNPAMLEENIKELENIKALEQQAVAILEQIRELL
ncbi:RNA polymerase sigma factor [Paenibacillus albiflavus]|uniref:RNA polymerase sigma factor n=1 Tax=Paenibacillus albiflavus TaxID=2545760 RepID=A0A4R4EC71_9BACL|nr:RNA polymerase sigma factor [Paenibacillus albiflavus]TCZ76560.1 RNA polymerase sigma factor [Paenibacillus albiflavus]